MKIRTRILGIILTLGILLSFCGCGVREYQGEEVELWLVTEESRAAGMNHQAEMMIERFQEMYPNVTIRLDILPRSEETRTAYLKKIRSEIMSGEGPDLYLMPTAAQSYPEQEVGSTGYMEPLFSNVAQQMYNGIFTDISDYYEADEALDKNGLVTSVMDAGILDGARYVLPLRYDYDVLLVDRNETDKMGIDPAIFESGIDDLYALAEEIGTDSAAIGLCLRPSFTSLSGYVDVKTENVLTDEQELVELAKGYFRTVDLAKMEEHQDEYGYTYGSNTVLLKAGYPGYACDVQTFIFKANKKYQIFSQAGYPFFRTELSQVVDAAAAIKVLEQNVEMHPVRSTDGRLVAEITYYAAVGSGCTYPELAYEFLRMFYDQELQWEQYPPRDGSAEMEGLAEAGFPVRSAGFVPVRWSVMRTRLEADQKADIKMKDFHYINRRGKLLEVNFTVTSEDIPILTSTVDEARFPIITTDGEFFRNKFAAIETVDDARRIIEDLRWLVAEG